MMKSIVRCTLCIGIILGVVGIEGTRMVQTSRIPGLCCHPYDPPKTCPPYCNPTPD